MQVIKRRNKHSSPCMEGKPDDDKDFYNNLMNHAGCRPSYMKSSINLPNCSSKEQIREYGRGVYERMIIRAENDGYTIQPCLSLESVDYSFRYNGYSSQEVEHLYPGEEHLANWILNTSSAVKLEFNFRNKRT